MSDQDKDLEQEIIEKRTDRRCPGYEQRREGWLRRYLLYLPPAGEQSGQNDKNPKQYLYLSGLYAKRP